MKTFSLAALCCFLTTFLFAQTEKGFTPASKKNPVSGVTYAVVIGISDYQDAGIPDLNYADKDAEAFADFLRSAAGGSLDQDHLQLLINKAATAGQVAAAFDWLLEQTKAGDQAIIYFSGHGDVERKTISQPGFLLCWDSPAKVYMGGGTFGLAYFQEIVTTLSIQTKAKVVVVTDACHAGKLAGSQIGGAQITGANLARQYANEVKILSCQPDEFSVEGVQWGGGRGVFSYHLVEGLFGFADQNADKAVTVGELDRYLEEYVTAEAAPQSQVPILLGNKTERLALVNDALLADLKQKKATNLAIFGASNNKGLEDEVLAKQDSDIVRKYFAFKRALQENRFFEPADNCAESLYAELTKVTGLSPLYGSMKRNYAAALQDGAQQELNNILRTGLTQEVLSGKSSADLYKHYPAFLDRAATLLGENHYMYAALKARKSYFEGKIAKEALVRREHFKNALRFQPDMPHAYAELISICSNIEVDSAEYFAHKAMELAPDWVVPYIKLSNFYGGKMKNIQKSEALLQEAYQLDTNSALVHYFMGNFYYRMGNYETSILWYKNAVESSSNDICFNCAYHYLGDMYLQLGRYKEAEEVLIRAVELDSTFSGTLNRLGKLYWLTHRFEESESAFKKEIRLAKTEKDRSMAYNELGNLYAQMERLPEAEEYYIKSLNADSTNFNPYLNLAGIYGFTNQLDKAVEICQKAIKLDSLSAPAYSQLGYVLRNTKPKEAEAYGRKSVKLQPSPENYYVLACIMTSIGKYDDAFVNLEETLKIGYSDYDWLQNDPDLALLMEYPEWKALMKKYFPDKVKD